MRDGLNAAAGCGCLVIMAACPVALILAIARGSIDPLLALAFLALAYLLGIILIAAGGEE